MKTRTSHRRILLFSPRLRAQLLLEERLGVRRAEAYRIVATYRRRHRMSVEWLAALASLTAFFGWMFIFGHALQGLEDAGWNWRHGRRGTTEVVALLVMGYGVAASLATVVYLWLQSRFLLRPIRRCIETPACFHCGYSLRGVPLDGSRALCPECGHTSPVAPSTHHRR